MVGVLIEVPVMLTVVWIVNGSQGWYEAWRRSEAWRFEIARAEQGWRGWELGLDVIVTWLGDRRGWRLADLLGRSMGSVEETSEAKFTIHS